MSANSKIERYLREQSFLNLCDDRVIQLVMTIVRIQEVNDGEYVLRQGDPASPLVLVLTGQLRSLILAKDGSEIPLRLVNAGDATGAAAILDGRPSAKSAIALRKSIVASIGRRDARRLFCETEVAHALNARFANCIHEIVTGQYAQAHSRSKTRVCGIIYSMFQGAGADTSMPLDIPTHSALAALAQVSRETVTRVLSALSRDKIITKSRSQVWILDPAALQALSSG
jgi:CRP-like cAMP-binding protein